METKILMLSKKDNAFCDYAEKILYSYFDNKVINSIRAGGGVRYKFILVESRIYNIFFVPMDIA